MNLLDQINMNQMLLTTLSLSAAGIIGFWIKDVPRQFFNFIKKQFMTTLTITNHSNIYYLLATYIESNYKHRNFRQYKIVRNNFHWNKKEVLSIGFGNHIIRFKNKFLLINLNREENSNTNEDKETMYITIFNRTKSIFEDLIEILLKEADLDKKYKTDIYTLEPNCIMSKNYIIKRNLDTIYLESEKKNLLINTIQNFIDKKQWYIDNGIPYHLGILLHGSPGTGKTSIIKALASYFNYGISMVKSSNMDRLNECLINVPERTFIIIEDIDCNSNTHNRELELNKDNLNNIIQEFSQTNFSNILNSLDGIDSNNEEKIIFMTTNHIEKLDPALIRPGRIDLKIDINYMNHETINQFTKRFYNKEIDSNLHIRDNITCAELQNLILSHKSFEDIIEFVEEKGEESNE